MSRGSEPSRAVGAAAAALAERLALPTATGALFGHQDALSYGHVWSAHPGRSDVRDVVGAHPGVVGFDLGGLELGHTHNLDGVAFDHLRSSIVAADAAGCVVTCSWHPVNPVTGGGYGDNLAERTLARVLPGGDHHPVLVRWLDRLAQLLGSLRRTDGTPIPIVWRPYHEHTGDWFWWCIGGGMNQPEDFVELWRFTHEHLTVERGVTELLWAISPDRSRLPLDDLAEAYLVGYPGDDVVDVLGLDDYWDAGHPFNPAPQHEQFAAYVASLEVVADLARARGKIAALTETQVPLDHPAPWTGYLAAALHASERTRQHRWALVWRNPVGERGGAPHPGAPDAEDLAAARAAGVLTFAPA